MVGVASLEGLCGKGRKWVKAGTKELRGREVKVKGSVVTMEVCREGFVSCVVQCGMKRLAFKGKVNAVLTTSVDSKLGMAWMLVGIGVHEVVVRTKLLEI